MPPAQDGPNPPDERLMRQFQRTMDAEAFGQLVDRYGARGLAAARQILADGSAAEDAVQEAFLRVVRARARYEAGRPFGVWFFTILRNVCRDMLRRRGQEARAVCHLSAEAQTVPDEPAGREDLRELLAALSSADRNVLVLRVMHGLALAEVGAALGISEGAAKKRVQRALGRLARRWRPSRAAGAALGRLAPR
jgi:RNA polymerase sigma-70 factor (ECF subfamily)